MRWKNVVLIVALLVAIGGCAAMRQAGQDMQSGLHDPAISQKSSATADKVVALASPYASAVPFGAGVIVLFGLRWVVLLEEDWRAGRRKRKQAEAGAAASTSGGK